uniref:Uncharacterized protein n=1 Tax=Amphiprion ocellaris TaxID=80972 RepID=A0AAQ5YFE8_AMPOC
DRLYRQDSIGATAKPLSGPPVSPSLFRSPRSSAPERPSPKAIQPQPEPKTELKPEPKPVPQLEPQTDKKPEPEPQPKTEQEPEPKPESVPEPEPKQVPEPEPELPDCILQECNKPTVLTNVLKNNTSKTFNESSMNFSEAAVTTDVNYLPGQNSLIQRTV